MFETVLAAQPDPILGLTEAYLADPNPNKINLGVGVYKNEAGHTPVLACVKQAEARLLAAESSKSYKPIPGDPAYVQAVIDMLFGDNTNIERDRLTGAHTPGGTGALRVAGDYLKKIHPQATLWLPEPTWANHPKVFEAAGVVLNRYAYLDPNHQQLDLDAMVRSIENMAPGDVILLHGCCHNPTGIDPDDSQWRTIANALAARDVLPLVDFAYQGFGDSLDDDARGLRILGREVPELMVASSYSKNFSLYNERVGALIVMARDADAAEAVLSQVKIRIRTNYSNPPAHGAAIVSTIVNDPELRDMWHGELSQMRKRIANMRMLFVQSIHEMTDAMDFSFLADQRGMFSISGLSRNQVNTLREQYAIYIVGSGRINFAGMTPDNIPTLCRAIADVIEQDR